MIEHTMRPTLRAITSSHNDNNTTVGHNHDMSRALAQLSPNLIHTYGKCRQRLRLSSRMRCTAIDDQNCIDRVRRLVDQTDDHMPDTTSQMAKYLDLIAGDDLKQQPFSRLQSRYLLRRISRVSLRHNLGPKDMTQDISTLELSSYLRRVCFRSVETLRKCDIESKISDTEMYCSTDYVDISEGLESRSGSPIGSPIGLQINCGDNYTAVLKECSVVLKRLKVCPNCEDLVFNKSHKNAIKRRFHSCLKGRVNNEMTDVLKKLCV